MFLIVISFFQISTFDVYKMAAQAAAALLDELMGRNRNKLPNQDGKDLDWDSSEVSL